MRRAPRGCKRLRLDESMEPYRFCPRCANPLVERTLDDRLRHVCPAPECGFVHWNNPLPVVAAVVEYEGRILLARNAAWTEPTMFALITGFLEKDETPEQGIAREVLEETSLQADTITLLGVYEFMRKNELIIAYHVQASGTIALSPELAEYRLIEPHRLLPWRAGTGYALAEWMRRRDLPVEFVAGPGHWRWRD
jgi:NADH pyrophosphatase NudC (nudix superfamily)